LDSKVVVNYSGALRTIRAAPSIPTRHALFADAVTPVVNEVITDLTATKGKTTAAPVILTNKDGV
jgi:hypothetical protein